MGIVNNLAEPNYAEKIGQIAAEIKRISKPFIIATHLDPDGDALGSTLGLARAMRAMGKTVIHVCEPPRYLQFLVKEGELIPHMEGVPEGHTLLVLDSAEASRVEGITVEGKVINIDHHGTNPRFGYLSLVDPSKAATAQIVKDLIDALGVEWNSEIATPVLTGLITDTGNFRFGNTTPDVLHCAAELVGKGVKLAELTDRLQWRPKNYFGAMAAALSTVRFHLNDRLITAHMPPNVNPEDSDDFVGMIRYAEGTSIAIFLREKEPGLVKMSIRSRGNVSAQGVAIRLGGGGHFAAAGASIRNVSLDEAYERVIQAVKEELEEGQTNQK